MGENALAKPGSGQFAASSRQMQEIMNVFTETFKQAQSEAQAALASPAFDAERILRELEEIEQPRHARELQNVAGAEAILGAKPGDTKATEAIAKVAATQREATERRRVQLPIQVAKERLGLLVGSVPGSSGGFLQSLQGQQQMGLQQMMQAQSQWSNLFGSAMQFIPRPG